MVDGKRDRSGPTGSMLPSTAQLDAAAEEDRA
jgi:hypothetical protein